MRQFKQAFKYLFLLFLFLLLCPNVMYGVSGTEKDITVSLGDTFIVKPWSDLKDKSGWTCTSTSCVADDPSAFSISTYSTTSTTWWFAGLGEHHKGYYSSYEIKALKPGIYIIRGNSSVIQNGESYNTIGLSVVYHVKVVEVTAISIPGTLVLTKGKSHTFSPVIVEEGANTTLTWTSSKPEVVSVTSAGVIKALAVGKSVITCTASNGVSAKCTVTVNPIVVTGVSINYSEIQINTGEKIDLTASVTPSNATNKDVTWSSSNPDIALVGLDGKVVGVNEGYCNIIATASDGSGKKSGCMVHVVSQSFSGDVNKDGDVSVNDVTELINYLLNGGDNNHQFTVNGVSFNMIPIQGGTITMGATAEQGDEAADKEKPAH